MNFKFENQGTYTYLVYTIGDNDEVDSMSLGMLTNNKISGLAPTLFTQMDNTKYIKYNVSAKISVTQFFAGPVNRKRLLGVFSGIVNGLLSAEDYMIDADSIVLDLDYIFVDVTTYSTVLICLPIASTVNKIADLGMFFKNIMFNIQSDQTENCSHVAEIINYLNSTPVFLLTDFKKLLDKLQNGTPVAAHPAQVVKPVSEPVRPKVASQTSVQPVATQQGSQSQKQPVVSPQPSDPAQSQSVSVLPPANQVPQQQVAASEKQISMFGLLMHYSKENAALYKAQKEARKNGKKNQQNFSTVSSGSGFRTTGGKLRFCNSRAV